MKNMKKILLALLLITGSVESGWGMMSDEDPKKQTLLRLSKNERVQLLELLEIKSDIDYYKKEMTGHILQGDFDLLKIDQDFRKDKQRKLLRALSSNAAAAYNATQKDERSEIKGFFLRNPVAEPVVPKSESQAQQLQVLQPEQQLVVQPQPKKPQIVQEAPPTIAQMPQQPSQAVAVPAKAAQNVPVPSCFNQARSTILRHKNIAATGLVALTAAQWYFLIIKEYKKDLAKMQAEGENTDDYSLKNWMWENKFRTLGVTGLTIGEIGLLWLLYRTPVPAE